MCYYLIHSGVKYYFIFNFLTNGIRLALLNERQLLHIYQLQCIHLHLLVFLDSVFLKQVLLRSTTEAEEG